MNNANEYKYKRYTVWEWADGQEVAKQVAADVTFYTLEAAKAVVAGDTESGYNYGILADHHRTAWFRASDTDRWRVIPDLVRGLRRAGMVW